MEIIKELPNPLVIDGANEDHIPRYKAYLERRGCTWKDIPEERQAKEGRLHLFFPVGTHITHTDTSNQHPNYTITFPDGGYVMWYRFKKLEDNEEYHNRLVISRYSYDAVHEEAPF